MIEQELPEGWVETKLGEIFTFIGGGTPNKSNPSFWNGNLPWASVKDIKDKYLIGTQDKITSEAVHASATNIALVGDVILITRINPGRVCISKIESAVNQDLKIIKSSTEISSHFTYYLFNSLEPQILRGSSGTTVLGITLSNLYDVKFSLPPLAEQHRIVVKIEELFSELDNGVETLNKAKQQLKIYRQSVLKYAFEGKLTNPDVKDGELPEGWGATTLKAASLLIGDGLHGTPEYTDNGEYYFINGNNLVNGRIVLKNNTKRVDEVQFQKHKKALGDSTILLSINGTIGSLAFYNNEKVILGKSACFINLSGGFNRQYVRYVLMSKRFVNYAIENATGSTLLNVGLKAVRDFEFNHPISLDDQGKIVAEIESRLSVCDKIEESIEQGLKQAEALRQSILKRAFEGKLVPQDARDENASILLERIKAERVQAQPEKKTKAKKNK